MPDALRLHWSPDSANLVVRIALLELGLPFEPVRVDRAAHAHKTPDFLAKNPQGLLPVLEDGPLALFETGAILVHLMDRTGLAGPGVPATPETRAALLPWLFYLSNTVHADLRAAFYTDRYIAAPLVPALRAGLATRVKDHFALLDAEIARRGGPFLLGAEPTIADCYLGPLARWALLYPSAAPLLAELERPALNTLLAAHEQRPAIRKACAAEAIPGAHPFTAPERPAVPPAQITG